MAKRGGRKHTKRIAAPKVIPIKNKKEFTWITTPCPGPHNSSRAIALGILLRDVLHMATSKREVRKILASGSVLVDGKIRRDEKFPIGLMDVISFPSIEKYYRILIDKKGRLLPVEIKKKESNSKILKVVRKHTVPGGRIVLTFHDGRNIFGDNHIRRGDSVVLRIPQGEILNHLKLESGAKCLIKEGKHAGKLVILREIIKRGGRSEALVEEDGRSFETVLDYLVVVSKDFGVSGNA